ncbi:MAG: hypothetical protein JSV89_01185 [Spirochaetaceae bacterium]|nr:MAG: hypothetical protein JSV89_01185 [Spirochaetaceae bacterium]
MVYFVRSDRFVGSKAQEAIGWALKVADYVNKKYDTNVEVLMNVTGIQTELHWLARGKSVGEIEELFGKLLSDPEYQKLLGETEGMFVDGTLKDHYYRSVSQARGLV